MTYADLVRQARALEDTQNPQAGRERILAAAERIGAAWRARGWGGEAEASEPQRRTLSVQVYAALVAVQLTVEGHAPSRAEALVTANRGFITAARAEGAEPQTTAELAQLHLIQDGTAPRPSPGHGSPAKRPSRYD